MTRVKRSKTESSSKDREGVKIILQISGEEKGLSKGVERGMGEDKGVVEVGEGRCRDVMTKEDLALPFDDG